MENPYLVDRYVRKCEEGVLYDCFEREDIGATSTEYEGDYSDPLRHSGLRTCHHHVQRDTCMNARRAVEGDVSSLSSSVFDRGVVDIDNRTCQGKFGAWSGQSRKSKGKKNL
jgi:hypothetical protein